MKKLLFLMIASTGLLLVSCGSNSYPGSSENKYPRNPSSYPRDESIVIDRDGKVITRDGRVIGNARTLPSNQRRRTYGSRNQGGYSNQRNQATVLRVDDRYARRDNMGRLYYVDQNGNVYWKGNDGYYHLDAQYAQGNRDNRNRDYRSGRGY